MAVEIKRRDVLTTAALLVLKAKLRRDGSVVGEDARRMWASIVFRESDRPDSARRRAILTQLAIKGRPSVLNLFLGEVMAQQRAVGS